MNILFDKKLSILEVYNYIYNFKEQKNLSVADIIKEITISLLVANISNKQLAIIIDKLATIEVHLVGNVNQDIQLAGIVSCIKSII